jgi:hypothetical protein
MPSAEDVRTGQRTDGLRVLYRQVLTNPPTTWDFLSQAARRQPPPRSDPTFIREWAGVSAFDTYGSARRNGKSWKWRHGEYVAVLVIPADAPFTYHGPEHRGHWMIYDANGNMLLEDGAATILRHHVMHLVHGPSVESYSF